MTDYANLHFSGKIVSEDSENIYVSEETYLELQSVPGNTPGMSLMCNGKNIKINK